MVKSDPLNIIAEEIAKEILAENVNPHNWLAEHYLTINWPTFTYLLAMNRFIYSGTKVRDIIETALLKPFTKEIVIKCRKTDGNRQNKIIGYFDFMVETHQYQNSRFTPIGLQPFFMIEINEDQKLETGKAWLRKKN